MKKFFKVMKAVSGSNRVKLLTLLDKGEEDLGNPTESETWIDRGAGSGRAPGSSSACWESISSAAPF